MHQLLLGITPPFLLALAHYLARHRRASFPMLILWPTAMLASALWAVAPDLPRLFGAHALYMQLADDPRMNIFFWHYTIDRIETDPIWPSYVLATIAGAILFAAWREWALTESATKGASS